MTADTDDALVAAARKGDARALEQLLGRHQGQIYRFAMRMCRDPEDASDILQDTLLAMARGIGDFRGASSVSTWLYAIARSFCIKKRRRSKFAPAEEVVLSGDVVDEARSPDEALAGKQLERALERAIRALEPMYREVLVLRDIEGLSAAEVAESLGITVQAVKSRLHRARLSVRARLAPLLEVPAAETAPGTCPDVLMLFSRHEEGEISADVCAQLERHLEACPRCRGACDSLRRTLALCRTAGPAVEVPAAIQGSVKNALRDFLASRREPSGA